VVDEGQLSCFQQCAAGEQLLLQCCPNSSSIGRYANLILFNFINPRSHKQATGNAIAVAP